MVTKSESARGFHRAIRAAMRLPAGKRWKQFSAFGAITREDKTKLERKIEGFVSKLYGLTNEEVEESTMRNQLG